MELIFFILIIVAIYYIVKWKNKKWYESLSTDEKTRIKELDIKLSEINSNVKKKMPKSFSLYKQLYDVDKNFTKNEELVFFTSMTLGDGINFQKGYVYITNKKIFIRCKKYAKNIPFEKISSIDFGKTMANNWIKINDSSTTVVMNDIPKQDLTKVREKINEGMEKHKNVSIDITQKTEKDISDKIARLKVLFDEGVLTEYEFNVKKLELLEKIK